MQRRDRRHGPAQLAAADTFNIEITGGLEADERVYLNPVQSDVAAARQ